MKINFVNNSVSGVNRKYRGFVLDIPGQSARTVDVPSQYVNDAISYLKYRHPAVICTPIAVEKPEAPPQAPLVVEAEAPAMDQQPEGDAEKGAPEAIVAVPVADTISDEKTDTGDEPKAATEAVAEAKAPAEAPASTAIAKAKAPEEKKVAKAEEKKAKTADVKGKTMKEIKGIDKKKTQKTGGKK